MNGCNMSIDGCKFFILSVSSSCVKCIFTDIVFQDKLLLRNLSLYLIAGLSTRLNNRSWQQLSFYYGFDCSFYWLERNIVSSIVLRNKSRAMSKISESSMIESEHSHRFTFVINDSFSPHFMLENIK